MPINPAEVQWDTPAPAEIDPAAVQWDAAPAQDDQQDKALGPWASAVVRPLAKGVAALPLMAMDAGVAARNLLTQENYEHPSKMFNRALDSYTTTPEGIGKGAEFVSSVLAGAKAVPNPSAAVQAPAAFGAALPNASKYIVPPSMREGAGALTRTLEGIAGKTSVAQRAAMKNQPYTNELASKALGLDSVPESGEAWLSALNGVRKKAGEVYRQVGESGEIRPDTKYLDDLAELSQKSETILKDFPEAAPAAAKQIEKLTNSLLRDKFDAKSAMEYLKELRAQAAGNLSFAAKADPANRALGQAQRDAAETLEDMIVRHLGANGKEKLAQAFDSARTQIAKTYSVEGALNSATGNVVATNLAAQSKKGKYLSDELKQIADFARANPKSAKEVTESMPGISPWDAGFATIGSVATGNPLVAAYPLARVALREAMTRAPKATAAAQPTANAAPRALASTLAQMEIQ